MPRRILLVGKGESLHRAWRSRSFGLAGADLEKLLHVPGFALDDTYHPVRARIAAPEKSQRSATHFPPGSPGFLRRQRARSGGEGFGQGNAPGELPD